MSWPRITTQPANGDMVQVVMTEEMARRFEQRCLGFGNTRGDTRLSLPLLFREDDLPTYIIDAVGEVLT
jgi:hypothetical protein